MKCLWMPSGYGRVRADEPSISSRAAAGVESARPNFGYNSEELLKKTTRAAVAEGQRCQDPASNKPVRDLYDLTILPDLLRQHGSDCQLHFVNLERTSGLALQKNKLQGFRTSQYHLSMLTDF